MAHLPAIAGVFILLNFLKNNSLVLCRAVQEAGICLGFIPQGKMRTWWGCSVS